jgi:hypothetical protein
MWGGSLEILSFLTESSSGDGVELAWSVILGS